MRTTVDVFGELRSALHQPPSSAGWSICCDMLERAEFMGIAHKLVAYANDLLSSWPDHLRIIPAGWINKMVLGQSVPQMACVRCLNLTHETLISAHSGTQLSKHDGLRFVTTLNLNDPGGVDELPGLLSSQYMTSLSALHLNGMDICDVGIRSILHPKLDNLRVLDLGYNRLSKEGIAYLMQMPWYGQLQHLELGGNPLGDVGVGLVSTQCLAPRANLGLARTGLRARGVEQLVNGEVVDSLHGLDLGFNTLYANGVRAVAGASCLKHLSRLSLAGVCLGVDGVHALVRQCALLNLTHLDLRGQVGFGLGCRGVSVLALGTFDGLKVCDLSNNSLGESSLSALAKAKWVSGLEHLLLGENQISEMGVRAFLEKLPETSTLSQVSLAQNRFERLRGILRQVELKPCPDDRVHWYYSSRSGSMI